MKLSEELTLLSEYWWVPYSIGTYEQLLAQAIRANSHMFKCFPEEYKTTKISVIKSWLCLLETEYQKDVEADQEAHLDMLDCEVDG